MTSPLADDWFYHYTTAQGLKGILDTSAFWATDANYLNDFKEIQQGIGYARGWLDVNRAKLTDRCGSSIVTKIDINMNMNVGHQSGPQMFVCSFTELGDSLSQWRAYGGESGYAIGFHGRYLKKKARKLGLVFEKCVYDHNELKNPVVEYLDGLLSGAFFEEFAKAESADSANNYLDAMCGAVMRNSIILKGKAFEEEQEWRLFPGIAFGQACEFERVFRIRASVFVPYVKLPLFPVDDSEKKIRVSSDSTMSVLRMMIGPTNHKEHARVGLSKMLWQRQERYEFYGPNHSAASYRNW